MRSYYNPICRVLIFIRNLKLNFTIKPFHSAIYCCIFVLQFYNQIASSLKGLCQWAKQGLLIFIYKYRNS